MIYLSLKFRIPIVLYSEIISLINMKILAIIDENSSSKHIIVNKLILLLKN